MTLPQTFRPGELSAVLRACRREFGICLLFTVVANGLMLAPSLYMLQIYDRVMVSHSELTLAALTAIVLFFFAALAFSEWSRARLLVRLGIKLDEQLNSRVFRANFQSRLRQQDNNPTQALTDLTTLRHFLTGNGLLALMDAPWSPLYVLALFMLHPWLGLLGLVFLLMLAGLALLSHRYTYRSVEWAMEAASQANAFLHGKLKNAEVIRSMGMQDDLGWRWKARHRRHLALSAEAGDRNARMQVLARFVRYSQQSLVLAVGALLVIEGELSPGAMIAANILMGRATQPFDLLVGTWKSFLGARRAFLRLEELLARYPQGAAGASPVGVLQGHVRIEQLTATAPLRRTPILKDLTADFPAGEVIGIVGPSGSGKSTLARALIGIWPYVEGRVLLDGKPIESRERGELGTLIGYLPQDIQLFDGTIAENVARFGEVDPAKVIEACQRAGIHDMILRFPKGYDTPLGEAGEALSGGQRQRIGLARAMYGSPRLIVLDEPNSNLDDLGEMALARAIQALKQQGSTVFLITHRKGILEASDRLLVLDDGVVAQYGRRGEVMAALQKNQPAMPSAAPEPAVEPTA